MFMTLAYITGGLIIFVGLTLYILPSRKTNLLLKAGANLLSMLNGLFIYLATKNPLMLAGIGTTSIGFVRELIYAKKGDVKAFQSILWPIGFTLLFSLSLIITYDSLFSLIPVVGSVITTIAFYLNNKKYFNIGVTISSILYVIYYAILIPANGNILSIFSLLSSAAGAISGIIGLVVLYRIEKKKKENLKEVASETKN